MKERVVVKIGSRLLTEASGRLSRAKLEAFVDEITRVHSRGHEVVVVSSGAVAAGFERLGYSSRPRSVSDRQACAAVGQGLLIEQYSRAFQEHGITVGQVLLTRRDFTFREAYNNALATLQLLLEKRAIPIINENDTLAVDEIKFGDNDVLAALLAGLLHAHRLILLTDTPGLFDSDPSKNPDARRFERVECITPEIEALAGDSSSGVGTGGMRSKIQAAKRALALGTEVFIGAGGGPEALTRALEGSGDGTYFGGSDRAGLGRKRQWIAFHSQSKGEVEVDEGAARALLLDGRSLLPAGIRAVRGDFSGNDVVKVVDERGMVLGKGIICYSHEQLEQVRGRNTTEVQRILGQPLCEAIHRDNWIALQAF